MPKIEVSKEEMNMVRELQKKYGKLGVNKTQRECLAEILMRQRADDIPDLLSSLPSKEHYWRFP